LISKEGKETRFRKLQNALEKIETIAGSYPEVTQSCTELRRINLLPPKKRRKSTADVSKDVYGYGTKEARSTHSPTNKSLKRSTSQSSLGRKSRASSVSRTVSPTPSVLSSVSALSSKADLQDEETLYSSEEIIELKETVTKLEEENKASNESIEKLEEELRLLNESKSKLEEEVDNLKQEKEKCDRKMQEMEELLLEFPPGEPDDSDR
ncbi:21973_t:CDS:1, partial [Racocetra persica]